MESAAPVPIVSERMKKACAHMEEMLATSAFEPYSPAAYSGHWNTVMMREGGKDTSQVVIFMVFCKLEVSVKFQNIQKLFRSFIAT